MSDLILSPPRVFCVWVIGDSLDKAHYITVNDDDKFISQLKNRIKDQLRPKFKDIPANHLDLYEICVPVDMIKQTSEVNLYNYAQTVRQKLQPTRLLSEVSCSDGDTIVIMVGAAPMSHVASVEASATVRSAMSLYQRLWGNDLDTIIQSNSSDSSLKFLSKAQVTDLCLRELNFGEEALLVRAEFISAVPMLEQMCLNSKGVLVTGQPGIGKSCFLFYLLLYRLSKQMPTALQTPSSYIVFAAGGPRIYNLSGSKSDLSTLPTGTWALSDLNTRQSSPCITFQEAMYTDRAHVIMTSSPAEERYKDLVKEHRMSMYVMDHFSSNEFIQLGVVLGLDGTALLEHSKKWGPSARTCVNLERRIWEDEDYTNTIRDAAVRFVEKYTPTQELSAVDAPHTLFSIRPLRSDPGDLRGRKIMSIKIATEHLFRFIAEAAANADAYRRHQFYHMINHHPSFKSTAGYIFERFLHTWIASKEASQELRCHDRSSNSNPFRRSEPLVSLIVPPCESVEIAGGLSRLKHVTRYRMPLGWIPAHQGLTAIDAIVFTNSYIITLQATIASTHDAKLEGFNAIEENLPASFKRDRSWHHVFVTDDKDKARSLRSQNIQSLMEKNISLHSAVLEISELKITSEDVRNMEDAKTAAERGTPDQMAVD